MKSRLSLFLSRQDSDFILSRKRRFCRRCAPLSVFTFPRNRMKRMRQRSAASAVPVTAVASGIARMACVPVSISDEEREQADVQDQGSDVRKEGRARVFQRIEAQDEQRIRRQLPAGQRHSRAAPWT